MRLAAAFTIAIVVIVECVCFDWGVVPAIKEHRIQSFCDSVAVGERADAVWNRGSSFHRERDKATSATVENDEAEYLDFSVSLPSLFINVVHCSVSVDSHGLVLRKEIGHED
jgi:hypothetical protein